MKRINLFVLFALIALPVLTACAPAATAASKDTFTPTPIPEVRQKVDVGGYELYIKCVGEGDLTMVLEGGYHVNNFLWDPVIELKPEELGIQVCVYDHAGMGWSDSAPYETRTAHVGAEQLHTLLTNAQIEGPYIITSFGFGADISRLFAHLYADDVAGLVMVNPVPPDAEVTITDLIGEPTVDEDEFLTMFRKMVQIRADLFGSHGKAQFKPNQVSVSAVDNLGDIPLVILWHGSENRLIHVGNTLWDFPEFGDDLLKEIDVAVTAQAHELTELSSNSTFLVAEDASAAILDDSPEAVLDAMKLVIEQARGE